MGHNITSEPQSPWSELLLGWRAEQLAAGLSHGTIRIRTYHLLRLARTQTDPMATTRADLICWLAEPEWQPESLRSARGSLRSFFAWLQTAGHRDDDPSATLPRVRIPPPCARPAPDQVVVTALHEADLRLWLMLQLAGVGGLRRAEISRVHTDHLSGRLLTVKGKGRKVRLVPLPPSLAVQIISAPRDWLFPSSARPGRHLTPGHVGKLLSGILPRPWTAHTLRHAAATAWAEAGLDLDEIAELLGHASIRTTQGYVRRRRPRLAAAVETAARRLDDARGALEDAG
jgi:integrase/recombinase XerD